MRGLTDEERMILTAFIPKDPPAELSAAEFPACVRLVARGLLTRFDPDFCASFGLSRGRAYFGTNARGRYVLALDTVARQNVLTGR